MWGVPTASSNGLQYSGIFFVGANFRTTSFWKYLYVLFLYTHTCAHSIFIRFIFIYMQGSHTKNTKISTIRNMVFVLGIKAVIVY